jgi:amino acid permease
VILVLFHFIKGDTSADRGEVHVFTWQGPVQALASFPVIVFAYTCHQNVRSPWQPHSLLANRWQMFSILNEIKNNSHFRTTGVVFASIGTACSIYILVAITGYLSYGDNIAGNIVGMYPPAIPSTIGRAAIVVLVMFSYPLQIHPCRASVDAILRWRPIRRNRQSEDPSPTRGLLGPPKSSNQPEMSDMRFATITTVIIILSYVVAMTVSSLEKVLAYVGSTGSTSISFILPGLFYYKISSPDSPLHQRLLKEDDDEGYDSEVESVSLAGSTASLKKSWKKTIVRRLSLALAVYGFVVMVVCLGTNTFLVSSGH